MKFVCEQCLSKYSIADEKVRGKILKIRCVKCGNLIEVRDAAHAAKAAAHARKSLPPPPPEVAKKASEKREEPKAPPPSPLEDRFAASFKADAGEPQKAAKPTGTPGLREAVQKSAKKIERDETAQAVWYVAIDNAPVGPITARAVDEHRKAGRVDDGSLVWREGMADWIPLGTSKELVGLLAKVEIGDAAAARKLGAKPSPRLGLFAEDGPAAKPSVDSPLRGKSLGVATDRDGATASLLPMAPPGTEAPPSPAPEPPRAARATAGAEDRFFEGDAPRASINSLVPHHRHSGADKWVKLAAVGFLVVALAVLCLILFAGGEKEPQVVEKVVEKIVEKERVVYRDRRVGAVRTDDGALATDSDKADRRIARTAKGKEEARPDSAEEQKRRLLEQLGAAGTGADPSLVGGTGDHGAGTSGTAAAGQGLSDKDFATVVGKNRGSLQTCYEQSMKKGEAPDDRDLKIVVDLTVGGSGMVKRASVGGAGASYPSLKACIEGSAKKWIFPSKPSESTAQFPFLFTPK